MGTRIHIRDLNLPPNSRVPFFLLIFDYNASSSVIYNLYGLELKKWSQTIGSPTISGINHFCSIKSYYYSVPNCIVYDLTARKQCSRGLSSSMILLNRNELMPLIVGPPMAKHGGNWRHILRVILSPLTCAAKHFLYFSLFSE
jgi:hypothetical protein